MKKKDTSESQLRDWFGYLESFQASAAKINTDVEALSLLAFSKAKPTTYLVDAAHQSAFAVDATDETQITVQATDVTSAASFVGLLGATFGVVNRYVAAYLRFLSPTSFNAMTVGDFELQKTSAVFPKGATGPLWLKMDAALAQIIDPSCYSKTQRAAVAKIVADSSKQITADSSKTDHRYRQPDCEAGMKPRSWRIARLVYVAGVCLIQAGAQTPAPTPIAAEASADITLPVTPISGAVYPSMRPAVQIRVFLNSDAVADEVSDQEAKVWNCKSPASYVVTVQGSTKRLPVEAVLPIGKGSCDDTTPDPVLLQITVAVDSNASYEVSLGGLPDGKVVRSAPIKLTSATKSSFSATPQAAPGEAMNNGATRDVGQMNLSYSVPFIGRSPVRFNTKDVFSTDSQDAKSVGPRPLAYPVGSFPPGTRPFN